MEALSVKPKSVSRPKHWSEEVEEGNFTHLIPVITVTEKQKHLQATTLFNFTFL